MSPPLPGNGPRLVAPSELVALSEKQATVARHSRLRVGVFPFPTNLAAWLPSAVLRDGPALACVSHLILPVQRAPLPPSLAHSPHLFPAALYFVHQPPTHRRPRVPAIGVPVAMHTSEVAIAAALSQHWLLRYPNLITAGARPTDLPLPTERCCRVCKQLRPLCDFGTATTRTCDHCTSAKVKWRRLHT